MTATIATLLLSCALAAQDPYQRIVLGEEPPCQGTWLMICYEFGGSGEYETELRVRFSPGDAYDDHYVSETDPWVIVKVPNDATSILVEDRGGPSPDKASIVVPCSSATGITNLYIEPNPPVAGEAVHFCYDCGDENEWKEVKITTWPHPGIQVGLMFHPQLSECTTWYLAEDCEAIHLVDAQTGEEEWIFL